MDDTSRARDILENAASKAAALLDNAASKAETLVESGAQTARVLLKESSEQVTNIRLIANDLQYMRKDISEIKEKLENNYVTKAEFVPIQRFVFSIIGILGIATVTAILKLILK